MLADYRVRQPQLEQVIFRIGTILGATVHNQITDLFEKPRLIAIRGADSPFVFIHDRDVVGAMVWAQSGPIGGSFEPGSSGVKGAECGPITSISSSVVACSNTTAGGGSVPRMWRICGNSGMPVWLATRNVGAMRRSSRASCADVPIHVTT